MISMNTLRNIISESAPENIPNQFIIGARITKSDGEIVDVCAEEMKEFISRNQDSKYRVNLATDIGAMGQYIDKIVADLVDRMENQAV